MDPNHPKEKVREMMKFSSSELISKPNAFEWPQINYEIEKKGWKIVADCIVGNRYKFMKEIYQKEFKRNNKPKGIIKLRRNGFLPTQSQYINYRRYSQDNTEALDNPDFESKEDQKLKKIIEEMDKPIITNNQKRSRQQKKSRLSLIKTVKIKTNKPTSNKEALKSLMPDLIPIKTLQLTKKPSLTQSDSKTLLCDFARRPCPPSPPFPCKLDYKIERYLKHRIRVRHFNPAI